MESNDLEEEEFGFSRNYFLAKELGSSVKKSARKVSDIDLVDEQVLSWVSKLYLQLCYGKKTSNFGFCTVGTKRSIC